jgi:hypothetical protein
MDRRAPEINVVGLMRRIRDAKHQPTQISSEPRNASPEGGAGVSSMSNLDVKIPGGVRLDITLAAPPPLSGPLSVRSDVGYRLRDLLQYSDMEFVREAYSAILRREPDEEGMKCYLAMLRGGAAKVEILGRLCSSPEGKEKGAMIRGLWLPYLFDRASRLPIVGRLVGIAIAIYDLPHAARRHRRLSGELAYCMGTAREVYRALVTLERSQNSIVEALRALRDFCQSHSEFDRTVNELKSELSALLERSLGELRSEISTRVDRVQLAQRLLRLEDGIGSRIDAVVEGVRANVLGQIDSVMRDVRMQLTRKADNSVVASVDRRAHLLAARKADAVDVERLGAAVAAVTRQLASVEDSVVSKFGRDQAAGAIDNLRAAVDAVAQKLTSVDDAVAQKLMRAEDATARRLTSIEESMTERLTSVQQAVAEKLMALARKLTNSEEQLASKLIAVGRKALNAEEKASMLSGSEAATQQIEREMSRLMDSISHLSTSKAAQLVEMRAEILRAIDRTRGEWDDARTALAQRILRLEEAANPESLAPKLSVVDTTVSKLRESVSRLSISKAEEAPRT